MGQWGYGAMGQWGNNTLDSSLLGSEVIQENAPKPSAA